MSHSREQIILHTSWISAIGNALLSVVKIVVGLWAGSLAVLGDGVDSATDVAISIVMLFTARIINRPPDRKYAYGYEKAESIATKILSLVIFYAGVQMLVSSVRCIASPEPRELPGMITIYVTVFSIAGKLALALYQYRQGKRAGSSMLKANAVNMRGDVMISAAVLAGLGFTFVLKMPILDSVTGLVVSAFILKSAVTIFLDSNIELMDGVRDMSVYDKIFEAVARVPGASNPHRVRSRQIGNMYMIVLDVEADGNITLNEAHTISDAVEKSIRQSMENVYDIVVHVEPAGKHHDAEKFGLDERTINGGLD
ncbi:MAG: cation diffusion facilitator family transporter [Rikenellaceae bacterium]|jgi:cation diffusion facilitator family transporter|nr:cation diffusion facilitator family transporter [Rikenellaceae bacterium]